MIYPKKITSKKSDLIINSLLIFSILISGILILINKLTTPNIHWAAMANGGIIYVWITAIYAIKRRNNIAGHVLIQTILMLLLTTYLDRRIGYKGWSIYIASPIILFIANVTMLILTALSYEKYIKYAIYQLGIVVVSLTPVWLILNNVIEMSSLNRIAIEVSILNLIITLIFCAEDIKDVIVRKMHM